MQSLNLGSVEDFPFLEAPPKRAIADGYQLLNELGATDDAERADDDRPRARAAAARSAHRPHDPRGARTARRCARCSSSPARSACRTCATGRSSSSRRPTRRTPSSTTRSPSSSARSSSGAGSSTRAAATASIGCRAASTSSCCARTSSRRAACANGATSMRSCSRSSPSTAGASTPASRPTSSCTSRCSPACSATSASRATRTSRTSARAASASGAIRARACRRSRARWIVAAELVETTRLYARGIAAIDPRWLPQLAGHLIKTQLLEPHWEKKAAQVVALERATLYGIVIYANRRVDFGTVDPAAAREIFIREALVAGEWETQAAVRRRQPQADRAGRGARAQVAPPGRARRRRADLRLLRPAGAGRRAQRRRPSSAGIATRSSASRGC